MTDNPQKRRKTVAEKELVNYRALLVKAYEYFELQALNKVNSLVLEKHFYSVQLYS